MSVQLALLGLLVEQPLHGYAMEQLIDRRGMRAWTPIGFSSIYQVLDQLVAEGSARVTVESAPGRGPKRRVHHVTAAGRRRWQAASLAALADPDADPQTFLIALSGFPLLPPMDAVAALRRRDDELGVRLTRLARDLAAARPVPAHVEAMFTFTRTRLRAERTWTRGFLSDLTDPTRE